ncbi:hypothetical protein GIB67_032932 [Kingdonia uniflora]|uniref:Uncharacterized protein n=1 Tax=Kingdonia uniflora TaxID=39325 RepID=A0A7J7MYT1_9MAGN|nr:hypothetical protein GIB67_032932 [Kingdonia uniflora]
MIDLTAQKYGRIDIMFSNAGILNPDQTVLDIDLLKFDHLININMQGMAICVKHAAKAMVSCGVRGSIVCTASAAASIGSERHVDYTMSKHAVLGLMRSASVQLGKYGIRVNCVSPSAVGTPFMCDAYGMDAKGIETTFSSACSLKGVALNVKHVADAVSSESTFVSGHNLAVDGCFRIFALAL